MSRVFTANVFITKSRAAIEQLFFGKNKVSSFEQRLDYLSQEDLDLSFIASPIRNDGLLHFEYSFGMRRGESPSTVKLAFVETSKLLEFVLLDNDPMARRLSHALELKEDRVSAPDYLSRFTGPTYEVDAQKFDGADANASYTDNRSDEETLKDRLAKLKLGSQYYFAFGVGDDISNWDGPHIMSLAAATLSNSEGNVRQVDATFVAEPETLKAWSRQFEKEMGYGNALKKFNQTLTMRSFVETKATVTIPGKKVIESNIRGNVIKSMHLGVPIRKLLRNYIGAVTKHKHNAVVAFANELGSIELETGPASNITDLTAFSKKKLASMGIAYTMVDGKHMIKRLALREEYLKAKRIEDNKAIKEASEGFLPWLKDLIFDKVTREEYQKSNLLTLSNYGAYLSPEGLNPQGKKDTIARSEWRSFLNTFKTKEARIANILTERNGRSITSRMTAPVFAFEKAARKLGPQTGSVSPLHLAYDSFMDSRPKGMNESGIGNTQEYTDAQKVAEANKLKANMNEISKKINTGSNYEAAGSEQRTLEEIRAFNFSEEGSIKLILNVINKGTQYHESGFIPLLSPLSKFSGGLKLNAEGFTTKPFDFFEETDVRILKLWKKYNLIADSSRSAFVYGDIKGIRDVLYLNKISIKDREEGSDAWHQATRLWSSATGKDPYESGANYPESTKSLKDYQEEFSEIFLKKSKRVSSFEVSDDVDDLSISKLLSKDRAAKFKSLDILLKHNIPNPNVVSLDYQMDNYIASLYGLSIRPELDKQLIGTTRIALVASVATKVIGEKYIKQIFEEVGGKTLDHEEFRARLVANPAAYSKFAKHLHKQSEKYEELADLSEFDVVSMLILVKNYQEIIDDEESSMSLVTPAQRLINVQADIMDRYLRQLTDIQVKTLPFFNHKLFVGKSCGLVGMTGGLVGAKTDLRHLAPYTGEYSLVGWKHVISASEISTTLSLIREGYTEANITSTATVRDLIISELEKNINEIEEGKRISSWGEGAEYGAQYIAAGAQYVAELVGMENKEGLTRYRNEGDKALLKKLKEQLESLQ
jgi:transposase-like protein